MDEFYEKISNFDGIRKHDLKIIRQSEPWRLRRRHAVKMINILIMTALLIFVLLRIFNGTAVELLKMQQAYRSKYNSGDSSSNSSHRPVLNTKHIKVPWRFQIEDDGFVFPRINEEKERFIAYRPGAIRWSKQLLQFENAVLFAYLLKRTLLVPPLLQVTSEKNQNDNNTRDKGNFSELPISSILDFYHLSNIISLKEVSNRSLTIEMINKTTFSLCHDHRLGFWVDYIPSVENIGIWRLLRAQQFKAFPISLDDHESDLMCPGTIQYSNRWGPPMNVKPILRGILTELYHKDEDIIIFEGDTLSTRDIRFFDKDRTKKMQEILIFHVQFSRDLNTILTVLTRNIEESYNSILSGPLSDDQNVSTILKKKIQAQRFSETSKTIFVSCRPEDENKFLFLKELGFKVLFESQVMKTYTVRQKSRLKRDVQRLCALILCAYGTQFVAIGESPDLFYVEHLRLQNVTIKDGLVADKINVRWAQHTKLPKKDERVLLANRNTQKNVKQKPKNTSTVENAKLKGVSGQNYTRELNGTIHDRMSIRSNVTTTNSTNARPMRKPRSRLDIMVCSFCHYMRRITGEHGCPSLASWCP